MFYGRKQNPIEKDKWIFYVLFLTSIDTCLFGTNNVYLFRLVPRIIGISFLVFEILKNKTLYINKRIFMVLGGMLLIQSMSSLLNGEDIFTYVSRVLFFLVAFMITSLVPFKYFSNVYVEFMYFVSIVALFLEILAYIIPGFIQMFPQVVNTEGQIFYSCFLGAIHRNSFGRTLIRSSSIFWEPGAYAVYLSFALLIEWFVNEKIDFKRSSVFLIAMITTFSTTGYIAVWLMMFSFVLLKSKEKKLKIIFVALSVFMLICILNPENELYDMVFAKIQNQSSSTITRISSIYNGMQISLEHPLFGVASNTEQYMKDIIRDTSAKFTTGGVIITNTIVGQFACYGIIYGSLYLIGLIKFSKKICNSKYLWIMIFITIVAVYSGERFFSFFAYIWMFYGYKKDIGFGK